MINQVNTQSHWLEEWWKGVHRTKVNLIERQIKVILIENEKEERWQASLFLTSQKNERLVKIEILGGWGRKLRYVQEKTAIFVRLRGTSLRKKNKTRINISCRSTRRLWDGDEHSDFYSGYKNNRVLYLSDLVYVGLFILMSFTNLHNRRHNRTVLSPELNRSSLIRAISNWFTRKPNGVPSY